MKNNMNADEPKVGWSDYQEITDDTDIELWHEARTSGLGAWRASLKRIILSRKYQRAFKKFQLEKRRQRTNWKENEFFSTVSSTAVIAGKPSRAPWRRSFAQKLACGT
jgi:hypothetical protein